MIERDTVLVLGAGASIPYGFPSGRDLLLEICEYIQGDYVEWNEAFEETTHFNWQAAKDFAKALRRSHLPSVDRFLELNQDYTPIGKFCIALCLIPYEDPIKLMKRGRGPSRDDYKWYEYLWEKLTEGVQQAPEFRQNNLSVVTFNYDRSLDYFLTASLKHAYPVNMEHAANAREDGVPIVHVHGKLGSLFGGNVPQRDYSEGHHTQSALHAADSIELVHESDDREKFKEAQKLMRGAELICFLGNGYHRSNMEKLDLNSVFGENANHTPEVRGTGVGLVPTEVTDKKEMFGEWTPPDSEISAQFPSPGTTNLELLRRQVRLQ